MAENKVRFLRGTAQEYTDAVKDDSTFYFTTDDKILHIGDKYVSGGVISDTELKFSVVDGILNVTYDDGGNA